MSTDAPSSGSFTIAANNIRRRHRHYRRHNLPDRHTLAPVSLPLPNPSPNCPSVSIYGPFRSSTVQTPLHTSDYVDSDDEDLFDSILRRLADLHQDQLQSNQSSRTAKSFVDSLPFVKFTDSLLKSSSRSCSICKDEFSVGEKGIHLPCKHIFHQDCIVPWLNRSNSCPLCRHKLPVEPNPKPIMMYLVRVGDLWVQGWGEDHESGFCDAALRNGLTALLHGQSSSLSSSTRMGRGRAGSGSEDAITSAFFEREGDAMLDEDGDTLMLDA